MKTIWLLMILVLLLGACSPPTPAAEPATPTPAPTLMDPQVYKTPAPDARAAVQAFLNAWEEGDYAAMYALFDEASRAATAEADFIQYMQDLAGQVALTDLDYEVFSTTVSPSQAEAAYQVSLRSSRVGEVPSTTQMNLTREGGRWRVVWDPAVLFAGLAGGQKLWLDTDGYTPARANIYDRNGDPLAAPDEVTAVGLMPDLLPTDDPMEDDDDRKDGKSRAERLREQLYSLLARLTGIPAENLVRMVDSALPGEYIPLGEYPREQVYAGLAEFDGVMISDYSGRYYYDNGAAPHAVGYVGLVPAEQLESYLRRGFRQDEMVGQYGLEAWGEPYLLGKRGGVLYVVSPEGQPVQKVAEAASEPSQDIYTTFDREFQSAVQWALRGFRGAAVVLERDTGRILGIASSPGFDPNAFAPNNYNSYALLSEIYAPSQPLYNRAARGVYPLGSVFKIITLAAALESGVYTPETTYECGYTFTELAGMTLNDWTWEHFQEDEKTQPSGLLTLTESLVRSCNPYYWHIGLDLYNRGLTTAVSDMARGFGLGSVTGAEGMQEETGNIPDPQNDVDAVNLAIGQGDTLVTPLQVASFVAAVGNGGTLYTPQMIEQVAVPGGEPTQIFEPKERGKLPVSAENLAVIQEAMTGVVSSRTPRGTAEHVFRGLNIDLAGKTGTAETSVGVPHAWFAGYTFEGREDRPDIAVAVIVENIGEGSDYAAPVFRRIVEQYYYGRPGRLYPWEESYYVEKTEEPEEEGEAVETPQP